MPHALLNEHADLATAIDILDSWAARDMERRRLPGLAMGIIHNGDLLWGKVMARLIWRAARR